MMTPSQRFIADIVLPVDASHEVFAPGAVDVVDGEITWVGLAEEAPRVEGIEEHSIGGLLMPGLVNVHCHSPMTLFRGMGDGASLRHWLTQIMWPREGRLGATDIAWGMRLAAAELLSYGVTTTCEMYYWSEVIADAASEAGLRSLVTPPIGDTPGRGKFDTWEESADAVVDMVARYRGHPLIEVGVAVHSAYTAPVEALDRAATLAAEHDLLLHIHVAESRDEDIGIRRRYGVSAPRLLADRSVLDLDRVLAAHSVWLSDDDLDLFATHDVAVAHCPQSNAKLGSGTARLTDMIDRGIRVGLGTDGPASNNNLNLWEEMRLAPLMARTRSHNAEAVPSQLALELATRRGAEALGRSDLGSLEVGRQADMIRLDLHESSFVPLIETADLVAHLVWSVDSRAVTDVWVRGRQVVADGVCLTVDVDEASEQVQARAMMLKS
ncbi:MAG: amidohydrolase family protein [Acidimicrobiia bacterium]